MAKARTPDPVAPVPDPTDFDRQAQEGARLTDGIGLDADALGLPSPQEAAALDRDAGKRLKHVSDAEKKFRKLGVRFDRMMSRHGPAAAGIIDPIMGPSAGAAVVASKRRLASILGEQEMVHVDMQDDRGNLIEVGNYKPSEIEVEGDINAFVTNMLVNNPRYGDRTYIVSIIGQDGTRRPWTKINRQQQPFSIQGTPGPDIAMARLLLDRFPNLQGSQGQGQGMGIKEQLETLAEAKKLLAPEGKGGGGMMEMMLMLKMMEEKPPPPPPPLPTTDPAIVATLGQIGNALAAISQRIDRVEASQGAPLAPSAQQVAQATTDSLLRVADIMRPTQVDPVAAVRPLLDLQTQAAERAEERHRMQMQMDKDKHAMEMQLLAQQFQHDREADKSRFDLVVSQLQQQPQTKSATEVMLEMAQGFRAMREVASEMMPGGGGGGEGPEVSMGGAGVLGQVLAMGPDFMGAASDLIAQLRGGPPPPPPQPVRQIQRRQEQPRPAQQPQPQPVQQAAEAPRLRIVPPPETTPVAAPVPAQPQPVPVVQQPAQAPPPAPEPEVELPPEVTPEVEPEVLVEEDEVEEYEAPGQVPSTAIPHLLGLITAKEDAEILANVFPLLTIMQGPEMGVAKLVAAMRDSSKERDAGEVLLLFETLLNGFMGSGQLPEEQANHIMGVLERRVDGIMGVLATDNRAEPEPQDLPEAPPA